MDVDAEDAPALEEEREEDEEPGFYVDNVASDPLFMSRESMFDETDRGTESAASKPSGRPSAFDDDPAIRHAYIRAFVGAAFDGMTRSAVANMLEGNRQLLLDASSRSTSLEYAGLQDFARTLRTVERRLGVATEELIVYLVLCPICWAPHLPETLAKLESDECDRPGCSGILFRVKRDASGRDKRIPNLTLPFTPPSLAIQRMCLQPGKLEQWQEWRKEDDAPGHRPPSTSTGYDAFPDLDAPLHDITDGWRWRTIQAGLERRRNGTWDVKDVDVQNLRMQYVALPYGLVLQVNLDWFQAAKNVCHSTGALYGTISNNPRAIRHLREETILFALFPGPSEPTEEQFNNIMEFIVEQIKPLYDGRYFDVYGKAEQEIIHVHVETDCSDLLGARKLSGLLSATSKWFMCDRCEVPFFALVDADSYDSAKITKRDPWRYLKYSFRARDASEKIAEEIADRRGIRYAPVHNLVGWLPGETNLLDPMHAFFGTLARHICKNILYNTGMINTRTLKKMEDVYKNIDWPPSVSRLPPTITRGAGSIKADQWRSHFAVFFVVLFAGWEEEGVIPLGDAKEPEERTKVAAAKRSQEKLVRKRMRENLLHKNPSASEEELEAIEDVTMDRSFRRHYEAVLKFSAALRIITSHSISPNEIRRGCRLLELAVQDLANMHCHLVPYFHLAATHTEAQLLKYGPMPSWWTYPYERNNGFLGRFNHNGHSGGELEGTMMRGFWKGTMVQELLAHFESMESPVQLDITSMELLKSKIKGGTSERQGTLEHYLPCPSTAPIRFVEFPPLNRIHSLRALMLYYPVLEFLKELWGQKVCLIADVAPKKEQDDFPFMDDVQSYSHLWFQKRRYGAATQYSGKPARYAYIDTRIPVEIQYIFKIDRTIEDGVILTATCAVLRRFQRNKGRRDFPWDLRATDLGVQTCQRDALGELEVVSIERLSGQLIRVPITVCSEALGVLIAYDHNGQLRLHHSPTTYTTLARSTPIVLESLLVDMDRQSRGVGYGGMDIVVAVVVIVIKERDRLLGVFEIEFADRFEHLLNSVLDVSVRLGFHRGRGKRWVDGWGLLADELNYASVPAGVVSERACPIGTKHVGVGLRVLGIENKTATGFGRRISRCDVVIRFGAEAHDD
ncbi:hypothetical protein C8F01DRAFT_1271383 [Mycena amicta]|nr:hypothetical protein C8F01DRAFT_1271383 [Mycena amicta]